MKAVVTAEWTAAGFDRLEALGYDAAHLGWGATGQALTPEQLRAALEGAALLVTEIEAVDQALLDAVPTLRMVATARGTPSNVDLDVCERRGIPVLTAPGRNAASVADFVLGILLVEARGIARAQRHLRDVGWHVGDDLPYRRFRGPELGGRRLGLVGYGAVGREVAMRAAGFGMEVVAHDPHLAEADVPLVTLGELLATSDVVSLHTPATPQPLLGTAQLTAMKPTAYLVNTARAACIDEAALVDALRRRRIAGAALDVFWTEPLPRDHPLLGLDNVTLTPHLAGAADDVVAHHTDLICTALERLAAR